MGKAANYKRYIDHHVRDTCPVGASMPQLHVPQVEPMRSPRQGSLRRLASSIRTSCAHASFPGRGPCRGWAPANPATLDCAELEALEPTLHITFSSSGSGASRPVIYFFQNLVSFISSISLSPGIPLPIALQSHSKDTPSCANAYRNRRPVSQPYWDAFL